MHVSSVGMGGTLDLVIAVWLRGAGKLPLELQKDKQAQTKQNTLLWNSSKDRDGVKHTPYPESHALLGATRVILTVGDPVLAFRSLCRRKYIEPQMDKLRKGLKPSKLQKWSRGKNTDALKKDPMAALDVMKDDYDGVGFLYFLHRWLGKHHPFDTLVVNMDHIAKPEVQAAVAWFAQMDNATHPPPFIKERHSSKASPGYAELRETAALKPAADFLESLPPIMFIPRSETCCPEMPALSNAWEAGKLDVRDSFKELGQSLARHRSK